MADRFALTDLDSSEFSSEYYFAQLLQNTDIKELYMKN